MDMDPSNPASREIHIWENADTGQRVVMKDKDFLKATKNPTPEMAGEWVRKEASLADIERAGIMKSGSFLEDPLTSLGLDIERKQKQVNFLDFMQKGLQEGWLAKIPEFAPGDLVKTMGEKGTGRVIEASPDAMKVMYQLAKEEPALLELPASQVRRVAASGAAPQLEKGLRKINVPGMEGIAAKGGVANYVENLAHTMFDPTTPIGAGGDLLQRIFESRPGQLLSALQTSWKKGALFSPGFHMGNVGSNQWLLNQNEMPMWKIPWRDLEAGMVQGGSNREIVPGLLGQDFLRAMEDRNLGGTGWSATEMLKPEQQSLRVPLTQQALEMVGAPEIAQKGMAGVRKGLDYATGANFAFGSAAENNARYAAAIDYLKNAMGKGEAISPDLLDQAARHAKNTLFDYSPQALTPFENQLRNLFPFYGWARAIMAHTGEMAATQPQVLARQGRLLDTLFEPLSPQEKAIADPWVQESGAIKGIAGWRPDVGTTGLPQMFLGGRYLPQGNIEQAMSRPFDYLGGILNPFLKAPLSIWQNKDYFKGRPIDAFAESPYQMLANPVTGGPVEYPSNLTFGMQLPNTYGFLMGQTPPARVTGELSKLAEGLGAFKDPYSPERTTGEALANYLTGSRTYDLDTARFMKSRQREADKEITAARTAMNYAAKKGDSAGAEYYARVLQDQMIRKAKKMGMTEGG